MRATSELVEQLIGCLVQIPENLFSKDVLVPLLKALGFSHVEFHGGPYEGGKDLILRREDEFGEPELSVVQVKKVKMSAAIHGGQSYAEIVTQLVQAATKRVPSLDGTARFPNKLLFVTPYVADTRAIEQGFEHAEALRGRGVRVYDGAKIAELVLARAPQIAERLLGLEVVIPQQINQLLSNAPLLSALGQRGDRDFENFYCDLQFGVGRVNTSLFLQIQPDHKEIVLRLFRVEPAQWLDAKEKLYGLERVLKSRFALEEWAQIEERFRAKDAKFHAAENEATISQIKTLTEQTKVKLQQLAECVALVQEHIEALYEPEGAIWKITERDDLPAPVVAAGRDLDLLDDAIQAVVGLITGPSDTVIGANEVAPLEAAALQLVGGTSNLKSSLEGVHQLPDMKERWSRRSTDRRKALTPSASTT